MFGRLKDYLQIKIYQTSTHVLQSRIGNTRVVFEKQAD